MILVPEGVVRSRSPGVTNLFWDQNYPVATPSDYMRSSELHILHNHFWHALRALSAVPLDIGLQYVSSRLDPRLPRHRVRGTSYSEDSREPRR